MNAQRLDSLADVYRNGLLEDTLPFWLEHAVDHDHGGYIMSLNRDGAIIDTDKGVWQQGRFAWMLGELYNNVERRSEWLDAAKSGVEFLESHCFDPSDGRMWFQVTREGRPIRKRRYAFSESFAAIAFGEYAQATQSDKYAEMARRAFNAFVNHSPDSFGQQPKFTDVRPVKSIGVPMIAIVTAQQLRDSIDLPKATEWIDRCIDEIRRDFVKPEIECVMETVGPSGELIDHFDCRTLNPGHAIEASWFIMNEGQLRDDDALVRLGAHMLDWMWRRGWDEQYGGILYFVDVKGLPVQEYWHDMKFWWPHNETIIATLLAHSLTGEEKYSDWHAAVHDWSYKHFADPEYSEWFGYLHRDGRVSVPLKGNLWKGPFHLPRMQLQCWQIIEQLGRERCVSDSGVASD